jgi:hypothetical protein
MTDYILFVFAEHKDQDEFVKSIAEDISIVSDSNDIKYYYGPSSAIITFKSTDSIQELHEYLGILFFSETIVYLLLPYKTDNMSVGMSAETFKHLFNISKDEDMSGFESMVQNMSQNEIPKNIQYILKEEYTDEEDEDDEIVKIKNSPKKIEIDEILDKISECGINSLSLQEKKFLETYSKTC